MSGELSHSSDGYIIRISSDESERHLHVRRCLYVGITRQWAPGLKLIFVKKIVSSDVFIGTGTVDKIIELGQLEEDENKLCVRNNWHKKIVFDKLATFHPPVRVQDTDILAGQSQESQNKIQKHSPLHGARIPLSEIQRIENLPRVKIIF